MIPRLRRSLLLVAAVAAWSSCSTGGGDAASTSAAPDRPLAGTGAATSTSVPDVVDGEPFPDGRCAANAAAGPITFSPGADPTAAGAVEVLLAERRGYFDQLCLDVRIEPATSDGPPVRDRAAGSARFASFGSFTDLVAADLTTEDDLVVATVDGRSAIDALVVRPGEATTIEDLAGATIGVDSSLPPAVGVMLEQAGLAVDDGDLEMVGIDDWAAAAIDFADGTIDGLVGAKSTLVASLVESGVALRVFDPLEYGVPGSFGVVATTRELVEEHPIAATDFTRATLRALSDAVADPEAAAGEIAADGDAAGALLRWETESELILAGTPEGVGLGTPDPTALAAEIDVAHAAGALGDGDPADVGDLVTDLAQEVYRDAIVVWPSTPSAPTSASIAAATTGEPPASG